MPFYKRENEELLVALTNVYSTEFELTVENHTEYTYPVDGWYWFETLDEAMTNLVSKNTNSVSRRQFLIALYRTGLLDTVNTAIESSNNYELKLSYTEAQYFDRNHPLINVAKEMLEKTDEDINAIFELAATIQ